MSINRRNKHAGRHAEGMAHHVAVSKSLRNSTYILIIAAMAVIALFAINTHVGSPASQNQSISHGVSPVQPQNASYAYIFNAGDGYITAINALSNTPSRILAVGSLDSAGHDMVPVNNGRIYVLNTFPSNYSTATTPVPPGYISVANLSSGHISKIITGSLLPISIATYPKGARAYVLYVYVPNGNIVVNGYVAVINTTTDNVTHILPVGKEVFWRTVDQGIAVSPNGASVYVSNYESNSVDVINTTTYRITSTIPTNGPGPIVLNQKLPYAYVLDGLGYNITVINTTTDTVSKKILIDEPPLSLVSNSKGTMLYVIGSKVDDSNGILVSINATTNNIYRIAATGTNPTALVLSPDGSTLYVSNEGSLSGTPSTGTVSVINSTSLITYTSIDVGTEPKALAYTPYGDIYVVNFSPGAALDQSPAGNVSVINTSTLRVVKTITVGHQPDAIIVLNQT